jgi:multidrug efflux pump subunit AcrA (membrane-fusion protein)
MKDLDVGKYVAAGQTVLQLANDADLEIPISLESAEVSQWLNVQANPLDIHWFGSMSDHLVRVHWAEQPEDLSYVGTLDRVETYDPQTRTFVFIVKVNSETQSKGGGTAPRFPLTDGMFCEVEVPGRLAENVYVVPREAVDSQGNLLVVRDGKLKTVAVDIARKQDKVALIRSGLEPGEIVMFSMAPRWKPRWCPLRRREGRPFEVTRRGGNPKRGSCQPHPCDAHFCRPACHVCDDPRGHALLPR